MNKCELMGLLAKNGENQCDLAKLLGISLSRTNAKINAKSAQFTQSELNLIKNKYKLSPNEMMSIFFD